MPLAACMAGASSRREAKMFNFGSSRRRRTRSKLSHCHCNGACTWLRPTLWTAFLGLAGAVGNGLHVPAPAVAVQVQKVQPAGFAAPERTPELPLDQPLRLLSEAKQTYNQVQTYECIMISQERISGKLQPEKVIQMSFRKNPFSVYMKWIAPKEEAGQEVCYVQGRHQNMMKVLPGGVLKSFGWKTFEVNDPMVMQHSRHKITEAGFGNWLERYDVSWNAERQMGKTKVQIAEYDYNFRRCIRVETTHTTREQGFYCFRSVLYFDKETHLPVRLECYDWPRPGGPPEGELLECFSYINLQFNVNIPESVFMK
jgi:Protein of unknown function (DUF1571)